MQQRFLVMGNKMQFNEFQKTLIRRMAQIQINSLMEIYNDEDDPVSQELRDIFMATGKSELDFQAEIAEMVDEFDKVIEDPNYLPFLDTVNMSMVKHILINFFDDEYQEENHDYKGIFRQIFDLEDNQMCNVNLN